MKRIHFITGVFPPDSSAGSKSFFKLLFPFIEHKDFHIDVSTIHPSLHKRLDHSFDDFLPSLNINYVMWKGQLFFRKLNNFLNLYTDPYFIFPYKVRKVLKNMEPPDLFFIRGQYFSTFTIVPYLKKHFRCPIILFFSDPFLNSPLKVYSKNLYNRVFKMEKQAISAADGLIFTTNEIREQTLSTYSEFNKPTIVLPHGYLSFLYERFDLKKNNPIVMTYTGNFYKSRQPTILFYALANLKKSNKIKSNELSIQIIGPNVEIYEDIICSLNLKNEFRLYSPLEYLDILKILQDSDVLINIDAPAKKSLFLPSKLIDYIGSKRPIWSISPTGPAQRIVEKYGGIVSDPSDIEGIEYDLLKCIDKCKNNSWKLDFDYIEEFESNSLYLKLKLFIDKIMKEQK